MIFICSPYHGDTETNTEYAIKASLFALNQEYTPITPHLYLTRIFNDNDLIQRNQGIQAGLRLMHSCTSVWIFTDNGISEGMKKEIEYAESICIPIKYYNTVNNEFVCYRELAATRIPSITEA